MSGNSESVADSGGPVTVPDNAPVLGYTRLSQESDRSIIGQKEDIREYCADRDLELVWILNDGTGLSGFDGSREKYDELRRHVSEGAVSAVVVRDLSRLSRNQNNWIRLLLALDERDVELHSVERACRYLRL
ncbi:recombinase family protein [Haloterrigena salinisoli]|uniref:recombinase family protein n=1 Tax=Haloterrigena salinisoli TaxID=3132747 RepID=UPI0030CE63B7